MREFNTTAVCVPSKHYMVDITERVKEIKKLVDAGKYFVINRARQYGKTTTLTALGKVLVPEYYVVSMDFQDYGEDSFRDEDSFCRDFSMDFCALLEEQISTENAELSQAIHNLMDLAGDTAKAIRLFTMFQCLRQIWAKADRPMVLMIDEVDSATNNQLFLDFLAALRSHYIKREKSASYKAFQSVILAGVRDVKHLKSKIRDEQTSKENSPWNIAADFMIDMSFSRDDIKGMLAEYEADHHTGMDTEQIAGMIYDYTAGYPFLVSRICQLTDVKVTQTMSPVEAWTRKGIDEAIKLILAESNTLFESLTKNLNNYPELNTAIRSILMEGEKIAWNTQQDAIVQMQMYGLIRNDHNTVRIANRIFEMMLYNLFLSDEELSTLSRSSMARATIISRHRPETRPARM